MSSQAIAASVKNAGQTVLETGKNVVRWCGRQVGTVAGFVKEKALVVWNLVKGFFKTLPHYFGVVKGHVGTFFQHIKNNKANSAGIAGLAVALTLGSIAIFNYLSKQD